MTEQSNETGPQAEPRPGGTAKVRDKVEQAFDSAREKTAAAYSTSVDKTTEALGSARERASAAAHKAAEGIEEYPVAALVGGLALGAIAAAFLPTSRAEGNLLRPLGTKMGDAAKLAAQAAREAGQAQLGELGLSKDHAREQVDKLLENALKVATQATTAAARSVRNGGGAA